jgi:hypothetical protein
MNEYELLHQAWSVLSQYIKDKQHAADHFISSMIDAGVDDQDLAKLADNKYLKNALEENGIGEEEWEEELDWEE